MKKFTLFFLFAVLVSFAKAQTPILVNTALESVKIYRTSAELNHTAKVNLPIGTSELVLANIANTIDENSVQLNFPPSITILSTTFVRNYLKNESKSPAYLKVEDSLNVANKELNAISNKKTVDENLLKLLDQNQSVGGANSGVSITELMKIVDYYKNKQLELRSSIYTYSLQEAAQKKKMSKLQQQLLELSADKSGSNGQLVLQLITKEAVTATLNLSYLSQNASWNPSYDLRGENTLSPLKIVYKANVKQNTGIDWKKVKLSLSTGMPSQNGIAPLLTAWFLRFNQTVDDLLRKMPGLEVQNTIAKMKTNKIEYRFDTLEFNGSPYQDLARQSSTTLNTTFEIDIPYDISSDNKAHNVTLNTYTHPANYKYYSVPKLENEVFLLAEITDYEKLNLLPGEANIIFENTYVGKSYINPNATTDTLNLSMGRDKRIVVKREKVAEQNAVKLIGSNKKQTFTYEITLRNGKKEAIDLMLKDQYPVSADKIIEIELISADGAIINTETGVLTWKLKLQPGVTQKIRISYSVKYPKDQSIANL